MYYRSSQSSRPLWHSINWVNSLAVQQVDCRPAAYGTDDWNNGESGGAHRNGKDVDGRERAEGYNSFLIHHFLLFLLSPLLINSSQSKRIWSTASSWRWFFKSSGTCAACLRCRRVTAWTGAWCRTWCRCPPRTRSVCPSSVRRSPSSGRLRRCSVWSRNGCGTAARRNWFR